MSAIFPLDFGVDQTDVSFVHQSGCRKRVIAAFRREVTRCEPSELIVDQGISSSSAA